MGIYLGSPRRYFWEWTKNGSDTYQAKWGDPPLGSAVNFTTSRYPSDGYIHMYYANGNTPPDNQYGNHPKTNFDPLDAGLRQTFRPELSREIHSG